MCAQTPRRLRKDRGEIKKWSEGVQKLKTAVFSTLKRGPKEGSEGGNQWRNDAVRVFQTGLESRWFTPFLSPLYFFEDVNEKQKTGEGWEDKEFSIGNGGDCKHHKTHTEAGECGERDEQEVHISVKWLKKTVEKFHKKGTQLFKDHHMDLKLTALKLHNEMCSEFSEEDPFDKFSFVDVVLKQSKVVEETALMRFQMELDEDASLMNVKSKCRSPGSHKWNVNQRLGFTRVGLTSERNWLLLSSKQAKRTKAKKRLTALQRFVEKKGDLIADEAITMVAKMCDID